MGRRKRHTARTAALVLAAAALSAALFYLCYQTDNKYTTSSPRAADGVLVLSHQDLRENPLVYLTAGWELYRGKLLRPADFADDPPSPDEIVFIGQYGGMEGASGSGSSPHGCATWRLLVTLPPDLANYTLEVPEIYSAYRLYINGEQMAGMGVPDLDGYRVETGNSKVSLHTSGTIEIIIAAADYSHYYSGMVYPPAFGYSGSVEDMLNIRYGLRSAAIALSLGIGLLYFGVWLLLGKRRGMTEILPLYYAALCLFFAILICYPVIKTLWTAGAWWFALESPIYPAVLLLVTLIQNRISRPPSLAVRMMTALGVFVCAWSLSVPFVLSSSLRLMLAHSAVLTIYTWVAALYLLVTSIYGVYKNSVYSRSMLTGAVVFGTSCVMDRLLPLFEPIRFGWFSEISGGFYVVSIGWVLAMEIAGQFRMRLQLEGRVESVTRMMEVQKAYYPEILDKEEELRAARHDFHHHMSVIRELANAGDVKKINEYAQSYDERLGIKTETSYCGHYVIDMLLRMYDGLARRQDTLFNVDAVLPESLPFEDADICVLMSNLLENALEASLAIPESKRWISARIRCKLNHFGIEIENGFDGVIETSGDRYISRKQKGREGIGIASVHSVCSRYGGSADLRLSDEHTFRAEVFLPLIDHGEGSHEHSDL